jgi:hypothetical protein
MAIEVNEEANALAAMAETIRVKTIHFLNDATEAELTWAPPGLSNHLLWHAGHSVWLQDLLCIEASTGRSELPHGWFETFSMNCRPVRQSASWPSRQEVLDHLVNQLPRLQTVIGSLSADDLLSPPRTQSLPNTEPLRYWISHGLHDEANHQGEMHLLLKMQRV